MKARGKRQTGGRVSLLQQTPVTYTQEPKPSTPRVCEQATLTPEVKGAEVSVGPLEPQRSHPFPNEECSADHVC